MISDLVHRVVVQFKLSTEYGGLAELEWRHTAEASIAGALRTTGAFVSGGQAGAGTMEIFIEDVSDLDFTLQILLQHLCVIAKGRDYKVVSAECKEDGVTQGPWKVRYATDKSDLFSFSVWSYSA